MNNLHYKATMWAEMQPDVYAGERCDQVEPRWYAECDGDMGGEFINDVIEFDPKTFPAGTKIIVSVPCCPKCTQEAELCQNDRFCDFDWEQWTFNECS